RGVRWSTADAYLRPALKRPNLTLHTGAQVTRVLFDGTRATGVEAVVDGVPTLVKARREVVLAGGSVSTPQLLMLSGVGPADHLREHGIDVVHDAAEVGRNLADHVIAGFGWEVDGGTLVGAMAPAQRWSYRLRRRGMLTSNAGEAYGFVRSRPDLDLPDVELAFAPAPLFDEGLVPYPNHAVAISAILQTPVSRGTITLRSSDPLDKPVIDPRYLSDPDGADRAAVLGGLRAALDLAQQPSLKAVLGTMVRPVVDGTPGPDELAAAVIEQAAQTGYHPVGTCRMGADAASVVDPQLRVRGVDGLRVADASVMPSLIRGHTNAPAILIGERAAQLLRA
ncbi:MAG: GMC family oxidoreductase N-terminal domain-containing protein, partial [Nocardioides sp.]|nr:GMC family oxidoreductase N-terminal domain-containing protein [Nocardioides sp.]